MTEKKPNFVLNLGFIIDITKAFVCFSCFIIKATSITYKLFFITNISKLIYYCDFFF